MTLPDVIVKIIQMTGLKVEDMICENVFIVHHKLVKSSHQLHHLFNVIATCISNIFYLFIDKINYACCYVCRYSGHSVYIIRMLCL